MAREFKTFSSPAPNNPDSLLITVPESAERQIINFRPDPEKLQDYDYLNRFAAERQALLLKLLEGQRSHDIAFCFSEEIAKKILTTKHSGFISFPNEGISDNYRIVCRPEGGNRWQKPISFQIIQHPEHLYPTSIVFYTKDVFSDGFDPDDCLVIDFHEIEEAIYYRKPDNLVSA